MAAATAIWVELPVPLSPQTKSRWVAPLPGDGAVRMKKSGPPARTFPERIV